MEMNLRNIVFTILGACFGVMVMSGVRGGISAARQCAELERGDRIELPSGRIMTCQ